MVVGARQSFQFFREITWFHGNNRALPLLLENSNGYLISSLEIRGMLKDLRSNYFTKLQNNVQNTVLQLLPLLFLFSLRACSKLKSKHVAQ